MPSAAKFTQEGTITVSGGLSENGKHIYLAVEDTGVGIPKSRLGQIFVVSTKDKVNIVFFPLPSSLGQEIFHFTRVCLIGRLPQLV